MRSPLLFFVLVATACEQQLVITTDEVRSTDARLSQPSGQPISLPGKIEAEDYALGGEGVGYHDTTPGNAGSTYRVDDVDLQATTDTGGGTNVGWVAAGEWLAYAVRTTQAGRYAFSARVASQVAGAKSLHVEVDGAALPSASFTDARGWQTFGDVALGSVVLGAGAHTVKVVFESAKLNLNHVGVTYTCEPSTCAAKGASCGAVADGCGGTLECGTCSGTNQSCGGGGTANVCGCTPTSCAAKGASCGSIADGCGGTLSCGGCAGGMTCGGGGTANVCGGSRFAGDPGAGKLYVGGAPDKTLPGSDLQGYDHWEQKMGGAKLGIMRVFSGNETPPWGAVDDCIARKMLPHMSFKTTALADIASGKKDAWLDGIVKGFKDRAPKAIWWTFFHEPEENFPSSAEASSYRAAVRYIYKYFAAHGVTNATHVATAYMNGYTFGGSSGRDWRFWHPDWKGTNVGTMDHPDVKDFYTGPDSVVDLMGLDSYMQTFQFGDPIADFDVNFFDKLMAPVVARMGMLNHKGYVVPETGFRVKQTGHYANDTGKKSTSTGWVCGTLYEADTRSMMRNMYESAITRGVVAIEYWNNALTPGGYKDNRLDFCDPNGVRYDELRRWLDDARTVHLP